MTVTSGLKVQFSKFESVQECRKFVEACDKDKKSFLTVTDCGALGKYVLPLVDRWISDYPGRVFVAPRQGDGALDNDDERLELMNDEDAIRQRLPEGRSNVCWTGSLVIDDEIQGQMMIHNPIKVDRLPKSEFLHVLARVSEEQWASIPSNTRWGLHCTIEGLDGCRDINNVVLISPESDGECSLFLLTHAPGKPGKYLMRPIPSLQLFGEVYKAAINDISRTAPLQHPHYLRSLGLGSERFGRTRVDDLETIMTRKQLNVLRSCEKMEQLVFPFFDKYKRKFVPDKSSESSNFENLAVNKRIRKLGSASQSDINEIFRSISAEDGTIEDHVYSGKRFRRLLGTSYSSHKWVSQPTSIAPADAPLASEVIGSI